MATAEEVLAFNALFSATRRRRGHEGAVSATWLNVALTYPGLLALGLPAPRAALPDAYVEGMVSRAGLLGDVGPSAPAQWLEPFREAGGVHVMIVAAADRADDLEACVGLELEAMAAGGVSLVHREDGRVREDAPGREHFGFADGISQPLVAGLAGHEGGAAADAPLPPGEFVVGDPGAWSWLHDGSYLVLRRLRQDVLAFRRLVASAARDLGCEEDRAAALLMGRALDGTPLVSTATRTRNDFDYAADPRGRRVPRAAHIRKANPRDRSTAARRHRIIRRGIPYGTASSGDRGLLFLCYQASIERQFEVVQRWMSDPDSPERGGGVDPIGGPSVPIRMRVWAHGRERSLEVAEPLVVTTGGAYFFQPSIRALAGVGHWTEAAPAPGYQLGPDHREVAPSGPPSEPLQTVSVTREMRLREWTLNT